MYQSFINNNFITRLSLVVVLFLQSSITNAVDGQYWDIKPPPLFDKNTEIQVNCFNYRSDIEALISKADFTMGIYGGSPPCGKPFSLYGSIIESASGLGEGLNIGTEISICLSDGSAYCFYPEDPSFVKTKSLVSAPWISGEQPPAEGSQSSGQVSSGSLPIPPKPDTGSVTEDKSVLVEKLKAQIALLREKIRELQAARLPSQEITSATTAFKFTKWLKRGDAGNDVKKLQEFLAKDKNIYPEGFVSGYFGGLTESGVQRFQVKHGIVAFGTPETTGFGIVGPATLKKLNELCANPSC